jgi:hypothetical protein
MPVGGGGGCKLTLHNFFHSDQPTDGGVGGGRQAWLSGPILHVPRWKWPYISLDCSRNARGFTTTIVRFNRALHFTGTKRDGWRIKCGFSITAETVLITWRGSRAESQRDLRNAGRMSMASADGHVGSGYATSSQPWLAYYPLHRYSVARIPLY